jgi:AcrR family transcriptional regulator
MTSSSRPDRSRHRILDAADNAFRALGYDGVSIEEIARRAGLTRRTVYNRFGGKQEIAEALIARVEAGDAGYRARLTAGDPALSLLERVLLDSAGWCMANPALARLALAPQTRPTPDPPADRPSFQGLVRDILVLGQQQGHIRRDEDAGFLALVLLGIYGQAMLGALAAGRISNAEIRRIVRVVVEGIGAPAPVRG